MTLSIGTRCSESGQPGITVSSPSMVVGSHCLWLLPGVGAVTSQNITLSSLGPHILGTLEAGASVEQALNLALVKDRFRECRQVVATDVNGEVAAFSGEHTLGIGGTPTEDNYAAADNILASHEVIAAMVVAFEVASSELANRLLVGLRARVTAGGRAGPIHSTAMKVVDGYPWPVVDLRIDWAETDPPAALERLWLAWKSQMNTYIIRAPDPRDMPAYSVPSGE